MRNSEDKTVDISEDKHDATYADYKTCECEFCNDRVVAEDLKAKSKVKPIFAQPVQKIEEKKEIDLKEIFGAETQKLVEQGISPELATNDDEVERMITFLSNRIELLERVITEAKTRQHAIVIQKAEILNKATRTKKAAILDNDLKFKEKVQAKKIADAASIKNQQKDRAIDSLRAIGLTDEQIKAVLVKKGMM